MNVLPTSAERGLDPALVFDTILFEGVSSVVVAVSGGSDSVALLHLLVDLRAIRSELPTIVAVTVDHGLRPEAADEARYVGQLCKELGVSHRIVKWEEAKPHTGLSAKAREARYVLLCQAAREAGADIILTGHTLDDQIETYAMREVRTDANGSGRGLAGMAPATLLQRDIWLVRPLLQQRREALRNYLRSRGIAWRDDPSNDDPKYERVRIRQALHEDQRKAIRQDLVLKTAQRLAINGRAAQLLQQSVTVCDGMLADIDRRLWQGEADEQHLAIGVLLAAMGGLPFLSAADICEKAIHLLSGGAGQRRMTLGRCVVETRREKVLICREFRSMPRMTIAPGESALWDGRWRIDNALRGEIEITAAGTTREASSAGEDQAALHHGAFRTSPCILVNGEPICVGSRGDHTKLPEGISLVRHLALFDQVLSGYDLGLAGTVAELFSLPPYKRSPVNQINKN